MADANHASPSATDRSQPPRLRSMVIASSAGALAVALVIAVAMWSAGAMSSVAGSAAPASDRGDIEQASLAESSTHTTLEGAPGDTEPQQSTDGTVVHPTTTVPVYDAPRGSRFAVMEPEQFGDTWLPVIDQQGGWVQVLLPSRPNGSTGWLRDKDLEYAVTPYEIRVHLGSMRLALYFEGRKVDSWMIGIGQPSTPTPTGRTFLLGSFTDDQQPFSPVILPLGAHSPTLDTFGGGPGTVAIHTWPTDEVYGAATSNGCIRVPPEGLERLTEVPLGTIVLIDGK